MDPTVDNRGRGVNDGGPDPAGGRGRRSRFEVRGRGELRTFPDVRVLPTEDHAAAEVGGRLVADHVDTRATQAVQAFRRSGETRVILVVAGLDDAGVLAAAEAGVSGLVRRCEASRDRLAAAVRPRRAVRNVPADLLARLLDQVGRLQRRDESDAPRRLQRARDRSAEACR